ncbi:hypothetical protein BVRB_8g183340 [Beta vulgaris subsp. vulgaris]|uniref:putative nuclear RNA export factor SDE5 isoform X2 n=1 Tax=Beta vulgaris subsp. vulgaris TaxID=3555 RepID=UPI00053FB052|nr:putative nuclear RNA export factor SDE5 isoform X2 [Beta vulgaris subsp. vulgaris]KMT04258.1 hypothetical protein BVRB_8g183340 [Beta vulgaris subsp. vulgaris]
MEAPSVTRELDNEDKALKVLLNTFGSAFSLNEIASAFYKAGRDANMASEILCGKQTHPSANATHIPKGSITSGSSKAIINNDYNRLSYTNRNSSIAPKLKSGPGSMGTSTSSVGNNYVWRVAGSKSTPNGTITKKVEAPSVATISTVPGKNCVWRIAGSNENPNGIKPLKAEANHFSVPVNTSETSLHTRDANSGSSESSSSVNNAVLNDDMENFLFDMLGSGFQLERSVIRQVLGRCEYDMKKSLETLLDLTAATLDRRNNLCEDNGLHSNSKSLSSKNPQQKLKSAKSNGSKTMRTNLVSSRQPTDRYEQQKDISSAVFHVTEQPDLTVSAHLDSATRSRANGAVVTEPLEDIAEDYDADEGSYHILRKAVKEHRETMKEYYKAAAEAFARCDRGQALLMLEKGQFFYEKAREADEESATKIFETSADGEMQNEISLDLQDHDAKEAIRLVKIHLRTLSGIPLVGNLKIIIGNDDRDVEKRKRLILKLLEKEAIKWIEDENTSSILIRLDRINRRSLSFGTK